MSSSSARSAWPFGALSTNLAMFGCTKAHKRYHGNRHVTSRYAIRPCLLVNSLPPCPLANTSQKFSFFKFWIRLCTGVHNFVKKHECVIMRELWLWRFRPHSAHWFVSLEAFKKDELRFFCKFPKMFHIRSHKYDCSNIRMCGKILPYESA